jgi:hypothetical protein
MLCRAASLLSERCRPSLSVSGARGDFRRLERPLVAIARSWEGYPDPPGSDTFCRRQVARTAGGAALARCTMRAPVTCPPNDSRLRETRRRTSRLRETFRQGGVLRAPAKELTLHTPKVSSIVGRSFWATATRPVNRSRSRRFQEGLGDCPHVVPNLWRFRRRLFNPCLWDTF